MIPVGIRPGGRSRHHLLPKLIFIPWGLANNQFQAVFSATKETI